MSSRRRRGGARGGGGSYAMTPSRIGTFHLDHDDDTLQIRKNASQNDGSQGSFVRTQIR